MTRSISVLALGAIAMLVAGCELVKPAPPPPAPQLVGDPHKAKLIMGCYTIDLFDPYRINYPPPGVSAQQAGFLGVWKNAAWNGDWCHDLYVIDIGSDGAVTVIDAYGPFVAAGVEAFVFQRTGRIEDGVLSFTSVGNAQVSYRLSKDGNYLLGERVDAGGQREITMSRVEGIAMVPIPPRNPRRA